MAVNIPDLTAESSPADGDLLELYDVSSSTNKKITRTTFFSAPPLGSGSVTNTALAAGVSVQTVSTNYSSSSVNNTAIPEDDTVPQITEGNEVMTQAITPKSATNILVIEATITAANDAAQQVVGALFQDANANALAVGIQYQPTANGMNTIVVKHRMVAGTTSSTTFRIRIGAGGGNTTFNGFASGRKYGTTTKSTIVITEYKA